MTSGERAEDRAMMDRLTKYADTIVTASVVGAVGLSFGLADADIRPSLLRGQAVTLASAVLLGITFSAVIVLLRRWEIALKSDIPEDARSLRYGRYLHIARLAIVGLSGSFVILLLYLVG